MNDRHPLTRLLYNSRLGHLHALCLLLLYTVVADAQIILNEISSSNLDCVMDERNNYPAGWIELHNTTSETINLSNYTLLCNEKSHTIKGNQEIPAQGYFLLLADKEEAGNHLPFKIPTDKESLIQLLDPQGSIIDSMRLPKMKSPNFSYGRIADSSENWGHYDIPTPNTTNIGLFGEEQLAAPSLQIQGGLHKQSEQLSITLNQGEWPQGTTFHYTRDGSTPTRQSSVFPEQLNINKTTILRVRAFNDSLLSSEVTTQSYIFSDRDYTLPVLSLVTDADHLFDDERGILCEGTYFKTHPDQPSINHNFREESPNYDYKWERPVNVEYLDEKDGTCKINQMCGLKVHGALSRSVDVKSLSLKADKRYGAKNFKHAFWRDKPQVKKVKSIILRDSGQDYFNTFFGGAYLRDAFAQLSIGREIDIDWQAYEPAIVFLNGQYYGILNIREKSNEDYIAANYPQIEDFDMVENLFDVQQGDKEGVDELLRLAESDTTSHETFSSLMDMDEFANYFFLNLLYSNYDFPDNNVVMWRPKSPEGRWRWLAKDMDFSIGYHKCSPEDPYLNYMTQNNPPEIKGWCSMSERSARIFKRMLQFQTFDDMFVDKCAAYLSSFASTPKLVNTLDSLMWNLEYEMPFYLDHLGESTGAWYEEIQWMREWIDRRVPFLFNHFSEFFHLGAVVDLEIRSDAPLYFNNIKMAGNKYEGKYYDGRVIRLGSKADASLKSTDIQHIEELSNPTSTFKQPLLQYAAQSHSEGNDTSFCNSSWSISYVLGSHIVFEHFSDETLSWKIPQGAEFISITHGEMSEATDRKSLNNPGLTFFLFDMKGSLIRQGTYSEINEAMQLGKLYILKTNNHEESIKVLKTEK